MADNLLCILERYYSRAQRPFTERVANASFRSLY
jgi:hypothetical protein